MKKIKLILLTLMVSGFVSITEAQIVVTSTTASTEHAPEVVPKSIRQKGLVIRPEIGVGAGAGSSIITFNLLGNVNYQFNPYIAIGGGVGLNSLFCNSTFCKVNLFAVPVYANVRGYFCNRKWSPYYDFKIGKNFGLNSEYAYIDGEQMYKIIGIYYGIGLGVQYKNFDFGIECVTFRRELEGYLRIYPWGNMSYYDEPLYEIERLFSVGVKFAYNFQIKKKK